MCSKKHATPKPPRNVLPLDPKPLNYQLTLRPNLTEFTFTGQVKITLEAANPVSTIAFNCIELTFQSARVTGPDGYNATFAGTDVALDETNMRGTLTLPTAAPAGKLELEIAYAGLINDKLHGFYRSKVVTGDRVHYLGTTQFESTDARRALPCWDEPAVKATFDVTIEAKKDIPCVLSNMQEIARVPVADDDSLVAVSFAKTPIMSTYLLAWTMGDMEVIEKTIAKTRGGETLVRVFAPPGGKVKQGEFALECACKILPLYEVFFGSDYLLPKCDLLAIPDFAAGAMENWGLITYRETALLCDASSSAVHRHWVGLVVAHELAHQWFGNLVTMDWWRELWLNEAFATWVEYWAIDKLFPEWDIFTQFVNDDTGRALILDGLRSSHPVEVDVVDAQEIDEIFDAISYSKGGSVLRQAIEYIGIDAFTTGIQNYLKHFAFGNATTVDLWKFLGEAAGKPELAEVMQDWTGKQGYPVVHVEPHADGIEVTQHRFLATGDVKPEEDETVWQVPLLVAQEGTDALTPQMFKSRTQVLPFAADKGWVKVNAKQTAFCRVSYAPALLEKVGKAVRSLSVGSIDRLSLIGDYLAFARCGTVSTVDVLRLMQNYPNETEYTVWSSVAAAESDVRVIITTLGTEAVALFNKFCIALYHGAMEKLGYTPKGKEEDNVAQLRTLLFSRLVTAEHAPSIEAAKAAFQQRETNPIPADLRGLVYNVVVSTGGAAEFQAMKAASLTESDAMERNRFLRSLGASKNAELLKEAIEFALSDDVRSQDSIYIFMAAGANRHAQSVYVDCIVANWPTFWKRLPGMLIGRVLKALEAATNLELVDRLEAFWAKVDETQRVGIDRSFQQAVEAIRNNAQWAARDAQSVLTFLQSA